MDGRSFSRLMRMVSAVARREGASLLQMRPDCWCRWRNRKEENPQDFYLPGRKQNHKYKRARGGVFCYQPGLAPDYHNWCFTTPVPCPVWAWPKTKAFARREGLKAEDRFFWTRFRGKNRIKNNTRGKSVGHQSDKTVPRLIKNRRAELWTESCDLYRGAAHIFTRSEVADERPNDCVT
ncbi:hypothetical protein PoB_001938200 [Plakobranchus ocellatus]|uniref:Uncharacterized protein n=1 Tax=Plakobranchus ocellatus TaxID=259542 RepID=A0AAV3ZEJ3_9GAST|nr:hypothetical protein PoB_001938200 [Plakobranchus ocellatus]